MNPSLSKPATFSDSMSRYFTLTVFLFAALGLSIPSGQATGMTLIFFGTLYCSVKYWRVAFTRSEALVVAIALAFYALIMLVDVSFRGDGIKAWGRPNRFWFAALTLLVLCKVRISIQWVWIGIILGTIIPALIAAYQHYYLGISRGHAFAMEILFGNIMMTLSLFCFCGMIWAGTQERKFTWSTIFLLAAAMGLIGSLLSGTRGSLLAAPLLAVPLLFIIWQQKAGGSRLILILFTFAISVFIFFIAITYTPLIARTSSAIAEAYSYFVNGEKMTGTGARLELWRAAIILFLEKPLIGWGELPYRDGLGSLIASGEIELPRSLHGTHSHNEFFNALAKRGMVGFAGLTLVFLVPMIFFFKQFKRSVDMQTKALAMAGFLTALSTALYGLTNVNFNHHATTIFYTFWVAIWAALITSSQNPKRYDG